MRLIPMLLLLALTCACGLGPTKEVGKSCDDENEAIYCGEQGNQEDLVVTCRAGRYQEVGRCPTGYECRLVLDAHDKAHCDRGEHTEYFSVPGMTCNVEESGVCNIEAPTQILVCRLGAYQLIKDCAEDGQTCGQREGAVTCTSF